MKELIIAPSVLSLNYAEVTKGLEDLKNSNAKWMHFDVMDGHFVPNLTFGPDILKGFKKATDMYMDVHVMIEDPLYYSEVFAKAGADSYTFHYEAVDGIKACEEVIEKTHALGMNAGISVKPKTDVKVLDSLLDKVELVLIMSVEPGFGGQSFMEDMLEKVKYLVAKREELGLDFDIEIDGGINKDTGKLAVEAGCNVLVAGSYIFKQDIAAGVDSLLCLQK